MATKKIVIKPPTKREDHDAGKLLRAGHSAGGRVLAETSKATKAAATKKAAPAKKAAPTKAAPKKSPPKKR